MPKFKCNCGYDLTVAKVKFIDLDGHLVPDGDWICPECGNILILEKSDLTVGDVTFMPNRFASMSEAEKKEIIHKRAVRHFELYDKKEVEQKRRDTIQHVKQKFEEGTKT